MKQFQVYYNEFLVGVLYINEQNEYRYICNADILDKISMTDPVAPALYNEQNEFGTPIPYFQVRVEANERFNDIEMGFVNDAVRLKAF